MNIYRFAFISFVLISLLVRLPIAAQEKNNALQIYLCTHFNKSQDLVFSEQIYSGSALGALGIGYNRTLTNGFYNLTFSFDKIEVSPSELISSSAFGTRAPSEATQLSIKFNYSKKLRKSEKVELYLGGLIKAKYYINNFVFGLGDEDGYFYENSINPSLTSIYHLNQSSYLSANLNFPLIALVARPEYAIVDNRNIQGEGGLGYLYDKGEFAFWGDFQAANFSIAFIREFSPSFEGFFRYEMEYWRYKKPDTISVLKNNFDIGLSLRF